jgi:hypothetical protein
MVITITYPIINSSTTTTTITIIVIIKGVINGP